MLSEGISPLEPGAGDAGQIATRWRVRVNVRLGQPETVMNHGRFARRSEGKEERNSAPGVRARIRLPDLERGRLVPPIDIAAPQQSDANAEVQCRHADQQGVVAVRQPG